MRYSRTWLHIAVISGLTVIQSSLLKRFELIGAHPDLALVFIVFSSLQLGSYHAQFPGFIGGLIEDILSLSPFGFHAFLKTLIAYLGGLFKGKIFLDAILAPVLLVSIATLVKAFLAFLLSGIFISSEVAAGIFGVPFFVELGLNAVIAPFLYGFFRLLGVFHMVRSEG